MWLRWSCMPRLWLLRPWKQSSCWNSQGNCLLHFSPVGFACLELHFLAITHLGDVAQHTTVLSKLCCNKVWWWGERRIHWELGTGPWMHARTHTHTRTHTHAHSHAHTPTHTHIPSHPRTPPHTYTQYTYRWATGAPPGVTYRPWLGSLWWRDKYSGLTPWDSALCSCYVMFLFLLIMLLLTSPLPSVLPRFVEGDPLTLAVGCMGWIRRCQLLQKNVYSFEACSVMKHLPCMDTFRQILSPRIRLQINSFLKKALFPEILFQIVQSIFKMM